MKTERVIFLVDIDDESAIRKKSKHSRSLAEGRFLFCLPSNYWEYDPKKIITFVDRSIIKSEEFKYRFPSNRFAKKIFSQEIIKKQMLYAVSHCYVMVFCKGEEAKQNIREMFDEICEISPDVEVYENQYCKQDTDIEEIKDFEEFLAPMLNMVVSRVRN